MVRTRARVDLAHSRWADILHKGCVAGGHVELIADRFAADDRGRTFDLATGKRVCMVLSSAGGSAEQIAWAERCAWFATFMHPSIAPLVDYGPLGETQRFEAWRADPGWLGFPGAAEPEPGTSRNEEARSAGDVNSRGRKPTERMRKY